MIPSTFERRYAKIEGNSLNIYDSNPQESIDMQAVFSNVVVPTSSQGFRKSSLKNLNGCEVTQVYDSGHSREPFQIQISGVTDDNSDSPPTNGVFKINFNDLVLANNFYIALRNISEEREYNSDSIYEETTAATAA